MASTPDPLLLHGLIRGTKSSFGIIEPFFANQETVKPKEQFVFGL